jgi:ammonia channel protein AmtB
MSSVTEFVDKEMVSIFRNTPDIPSIHGGGILSTGMRPLLPLFIAILIWATIGYMMYVYQQKIRHFIGSWLLYFHMGKNNEIYTTQNTENTHFQSLLSTIDFSEELRPF